MAREPPMELSRPPDEEQLERHGKSNKTHLATPHNSSYSSSNTQKTEAINTAISEREMDGIRKINSPELHVSIHGKSIVVMKSPNHDLYSTKNPTDSIVPIERYRDANLERNANKSPEVHTQIRRSSSQVLADSTTGDYSPQLEVHLTEISSEMDGGIIGEEDSGETRGQIAGVHGTIDRGTNSPPIDIHLSDIPNNVNGGNTRKTNPRQSMDTLTDDPITDTPRAGTSRPSRAMADSEEETTQKSGLGSSQDYMETYLTSTKKYQGYYAKGINSTRVQEVMMVSKLLIPTRMMKGIRLVSRISTSNTTRTPQKSDYDVVNSEDEFDEDTQSLKETDDDEEGDETSAHLIKAFGSTFRSEFKAKIQEVADQQGLSPRGRKQVRQLIKSASISTSANSSRPNTREQLRRPLWDRLFHFSNMDTPWCTIGDFNVITSTKEKYGGIPYNMNKSLDFITIIEASGLMDIGYSGQHYTWCNQRAAEAKVWKRLDRAMVNDKWLELMPQTTITHLPSIGSDHCPLLMEMEARSKHRVKYFKFLHCWTENVNFLDIVKGCWQKKISGNPMWRLHQKMKLLASTLSTWSKKEYGNTFSSVINFEEQVKAAEEDVIHQNTKENRSKLHLINAQYIKYLKLEVSILKQKTQLQWFKEGDTNSKYFHSIMRGRRRNLFIHKICTAEDTWIQGEENIAKVDCDYFQNMFSGHEDRIRKEILNCIPRMGRSISENIMLAQEITHGNKKPNEGDNVVIKLDMTKAYDRVSWSYTCLVLRRMGFGEMFIDLAWRTMSNNWYSVIINGVRHGFFHSTRGLKQGDPLSPSLFILGAEILSRMLNMLHHHQRYKNFQMEIRGPQINHLSFADDIIIFSSTTRDTLQMIMKTLSTYESVYDQLINKEKSHFMGLENTPQENIAMIREVTGFNQKVSPITYLGCPLYIGGQRIIYYSDLVAKIRRKIS
ncbi:hypothetical protein MTR67_039017 [Solanum verrucosum]|uniref:Reverse transcriptase domain-containing protein n=1 Tax=Solanum verrucosum TaxID=315347 RepID=A0AAF0ZN93_SOLVR|nr:hypothetical protein MTR67_039017 [Solanum verrucosum]